MGIDSYTPPVSQLLTYGDLSQMDAKKWPDYVQELGFTAEHVPTLIQVMTDKALWQSASDSLEVWAPAHAWRALGQLRAVEAIDPLLELFNEYDDDDYILEEAPDVFALMGPEILPQLKQHLAREDLAEWGKISIVDGIRKIAEQFPNTQETCIEILQHQLQAYLDNGEGLNGWLVDGLVHYQVLGAVPLIEKIYAEGEIDEMCAGTWPRVQVRLGLKQESDFQPDDFVPEFIRQMQRGVFEDQKISAMEAGLPLNLMAFRTEPPPTFRELLNRPQSKAPKKTAGFGTGGRPSAQKSKKKKK